LRYFSACQTHKKLTHQGQDDRITKGCAAKEGQGTRKEKGEKEETKPKKTAKKKEAPKKTRKKRRLGHSGNSCTRRRAEHKDHVWCWDFIHDRTVTGKPLKWLAITDEFTRECLALEVDRSITADKVLDVLTNLFLTRGVPKHIRSDNGPEFIAQAIQRWLASTGAETLYIAPGSPWENAYIESFNSRFRDELLNAESFACLKEAQVLVEDYRRRYNHRRPHSSLDYQTPAAFAAACLAAAPASAGPTPPPNRTETVDNPLVPIGT